MNQRLASLAGFPAGEVRSRIALEARGLPEPTPVFDLLDEKPPEWAVDRLIERGDINLIVGDGGAFKTTFALHMAAAIASGQKVAGHFNTTDGSTGYFSGEDRQGRLGNRVRANSRGHLWDYDKVNRLHVLARCGVSLDDPAWQRHLLSRIERLNAVAVFYDPLQDLTSANLNDAGEVAPWMRFLRAICELPSEPAVTLIHHAGKARDGQRTIDRVVRGSAALNQAARSILYVSRTTSGLQVEHLKCTDAPLHPTFNVDIKITERAGFPGLWETAAFSYASKREGEQLEAVDPVREWIRQNPGAKSTEVRQGVEKEHPTLRRSGISDALKALEERGDIGFENGPNNSKLWSVCE